MLGVDVSRYQASGSIDWAAWKRAGVGFVWVKGTDGGGQAPHETAERKVRDAKNAGIPVGLYGYAQLSPSPEAQADVLVNECNRWNAWGIMCALDLEDPHPASAASRPFAVRYLNRLKARGAARPVLYGNKSMLTAIGADSIRQEVPGTIVWLAEYGVNNGTRRPYTYRGHVDVHQYTSVGRLPGYGGNLDLNELSNNAIFVGAKESDMLKDETLRIYDNTTGWVNVTADVVVGNTHNYAKGAAANAALCAATLAQVLEKVTNDPDITRDEIKTLMDASVAENAPKPEPIDLEQVKQAVREAAGEDNPELADAIVDKLSARIAN